MHRFAVLVPVWEQRKKRWTFAGSIVVPSDLYPSVLIARMVAHDRLAEIESAPRRFVLKLSEKWD
jgi:hypothetical protein